MKLYICSIYDHKVNAYMVPQFFRTKGEATRSFIDACTSEQSSMFKKHAEDYVFMFLGTYEDSSGSFEVAANGPEPLMRALDAVQIEGSVN